MRVERLGKTDILKLPQRKKKLDFSKAFDTLNWDFLKNTLTSRGFPAKFIKWIFLTLSSASSKVIVNDSCTQQFPHKRGLRQGDPISPLLSIIAVDVLQRMIAAANSTLPFSLTNRIGEAITALQYADDTIVVSSTKGNTIRSLLLVIHCFSQASGLNINFTKSTFVPFNIQPDDLIALRSVLPCVQSELPIMYLGLPLTIKKLDRTFYLALIEKIEKKLAAWKGKMISRGGRLQLIKSVLSTIPIYFMSCFKLPAWVVSRIEKILRSFLWGGDGSGIPLLNWESVCRPVSVGGFGVTNLAIQNSALLLRWIWRLYSSDGSVWANMALRIYGKDQSHNQPIILRGSGSFFWNYLLTTRPIFAQFTRWIIGNGNSISFWHDFWGRVLLSQTQGRLNEGAISLKKAQSRQLRLLSRPLSLEQTRAVEELHNLCFTDHPDEIFWSLTTHGGFSVNSVYKLLTTAGRVSSCYKEIWKAKVTPSIRVFGVLLLGNKLLTQEVMVRRHFTIQSRCVMCNTTILETSMHLFFTCPFSANIWYEISRNAGSQMVVLSDTVLQTYLLSAVNRASFLKWQTIFISTMWHLWRERNNRVFRGEASPGQVLVQRILNDASLFTRHC